MQKTDSTLSRPRPQLRLIVRDGQRLRTCEMRAYTRTDPTTPVLPWQTWPCCGQLPTTVDRHGDALCEDHMAGWYCENCGNELPEYRPYTLCARCWKTSPYRKRP